MTSGLRGFHVAPLWIMTFKAWFMRPAALVKALHKHCLAKIPFRESKWGFFFHPLPFWRCNRDVQTRHTCYMCCRRTKHIHRVAPLSFVLCARFASPWSPSRKGFFIKKKNTQWKQYESFMRPPLSPLRFRTWILAPSQVNASLCCFSLHFV